MDIRSMQRLCAKALASGATRKGFSVIEWDISGRCETPTVRELHAQPCGPEKTRELGRVIYKGQPGVGLTLILTLRCRRCEVCRRMRRNMWAQRARQEMSRATRTWFGTMTLRPEEHYRCLLLAEARARARAVNPDEWSPRDSFLARHGVISEEITRWLKRVRKNSGAPLRYMLVAEAHSSGLPHYHVLVHEQDPLRPVRKAELARWPLGFSQFRLAKDQAEASYLTKYLGKDASARVRASLNYGEGQNIAVAFNGNAKKSPQITKPDVARVWDATTHDARKKDGSALHYRLTKDGEVAIVSALEKR